MNCRSWTVEGVEFQESAVSEILRATQGHPYFLQEWGFHEWNVVQKSPIRADDVERVTPDMPGRARPRLSAGRTIFPQPS